MQIAKCGMENVASGAAILFRWRWRACRFFNFHFAICIRACVILHPFIWIFSVSSVPPWSTHCYFDFAADIAMTDVPTPLADKRDRLLALLQSYGSCAVAFSGGLDSALLAKAAQTALGDRAVAVTGASASLAVGELDQCRQLARQIGIRHEIVATNELASPGYAANAPDRCFYCKTELFLQVEKLAERFGVAVVVDGANSDDRGEHRPGARAARQRKVLSPLAECGLTKAEIRQLAAAWELPVWNKPATPCLSSRIAYGEPVTAERLAMIDQAEAFLRAGFSAVAGALSQGRHGADRGFARGAGKVPRTRTSAARRSRG